jgi:hypothetical protein
MPKLVKKAVKTFKYSKCSVVKQGVCTFQRPVATIKVKKIDAMTGKQSMQKREKIGKKPSIINLNLYNLMKQELNSSETSCKN